jgi:DNA mismatch endonuclease (patch repair protein)
MQNTGRRDTPMELRVRSRLHRLGYRYRIDAQVAGTRSRPDVVFPLEMVAVFLDGCYWHSCPMHGSKPMANRVWWREKLLVNVQRDKRHSDELRKAGWVVLRFWEHEVPDDVAETIAQAVNSRRSRDRRKGISSAVGSRDSRAP